MQGGETPIFDFGWQAREVDSPGVATYLDAVSSRCA